MFAYCGNNPVMGYDPTGHWDWGGVIAGLIFVAISGVAAILGSLVTETGAQITGAGVDYYFPSVKIFDWRGVK